MFSGLHPTYSDSHVVVSGEIGASSGRAAKDDLVRVALSKTIGVASWEPALRVIPDKVLAGKDVRFSPCQKHMHFNMGFLKERRPGVTSL